MRQVTLPNHSRLQSIRCPISVMWKVEFFHEDVIVFVGSFLPSLNNAHLVLIVFILRDFHRGISGKKVEGFLRRSLHHLCTWLLNDHRLVVYHDACWLREWFFCVMLKVNLKGKLQKSWASGKGANSLISAFISTATQIYMIHTQVSIWTSRFSAQEKNKMNIFGPDL